METWPPVERNVCPVALKYAFFLPMHKILLHLCPRNSTHSLAWNMSKPHPPVGTEIKENSNYFCLLLPRGTVGGAALLNTITSPGKDKYIPRSVEERSPPQGASICGKPHPNNVRSFCARDTRISQTQKGLADWQAPGATSVLGILHFLKLLPQKLAKRQLFSRATHKDEIDHHYANHERLHLGNSNGK